ncbi:acyltransferase family protein [Micromonospora auratinigra]|uniref:Peptidoglycan/LPS O-acetylase OafA/YrhL, contains acyltransferase and SGNH-hydrolase domains n=1 Tax=Micromonospora auratinigra TaxID=261654 RepID=A0A1A8ZFW4_9ACTN|nr:acyltransferase [Micromonospora auratinigra]SBT42761.1 Peptidoglycan/LPS O-acetylase OafA/YrhL, contains acyltransferase and SGNH-hydrolase domains [Micromonospora auratinigra]
MAAPAVQATPVTRNRLPTLTGMRFIAALMVFADHAAMEMMFDSKTLGGVVFLLLSPIGPMGVCFFFVLSGFVLTWSAGPHDSTAAFWRRRVFKIVPNHLLAWFTGLVLLLVVGEHLNLLRTLPSLFLIHPWFPNEDALGGTNASEWSLACEATFYLAFPLLIGLIAKIRAERLWRWAWLVTAAIIAMPYVAKLLPAKPVMDWSTVSIYRFWFVYEFPPVRMLEFVLGILLARILLTGRWRGPRLRWGLALLVPAYVVSLLRPLALAKVLPDLFGVTATFIIPVLLVIGATATLDLAGRRSWANSRLMVWLGEVSFAFYLVHWLVVHYGHRAFGKGSTFSAPTVVLLVTAMLAVSLALTWVLYVLVERPIYRRWSRARRPGGLHGGPPTPDAPVSPAPATTATEGVPA